MGFPLYVICCFSLAALNIFSLYLIFDSLINMCPLLNFGTIRFLFRYSTDAGYTKVIVGI